MLRANSARALSHTKNQLTKYMLMSSILIICLAYPWFAAQALLRAAQPADRACQSGGDVAPVPEPMKRTNQEQPSMG